MGGELAAVAQTIRRRSSSGNSEDMDFIGTEPIYAEPAQAPGQAAAGQGGGAEAEAEQACLAALGSAQSLSRELLRISDGWLRAMDGAPTAAA